MGKTVLTKCCGIDFRGRVSIKIFLIGYSENPVFEKLLQIKWLKRSQWICFLRRLRLFIATVQVKEEKNIRGAS